MKQFEIDQTGAAMKVNTDGLCLAAWAMPNTDGSILDIGGGTGLISLMIAQRFPEAMISAIEPHQSSFACMRRNFEKSPWSSRLSALPEDLVQFTGAVPRGSLSGMISNPPYFSNSSLPATEGRLQSRHMHTLKAADLAECAGRLLAPEGTLSVIYPPAQMKLLTSACVPQGLYPIRRCIIYSRPGGPPVRVMQTFGFGAAGTLKEESLFIYNADGSYSKDYIAIMKDFLIIF